MSSLVDLTSNLKDSKTNSLLDYINYLHDIKTTIDSLENGNDALAKCVVLCGSLFANKVAKGEKNEDDIELFESNLVTQESLVYKNNDLNLANEMVREENSVALGEYESRFGESNKKIGLQKIA